MLRSKQLMVCLAAGAAAMSAVVIGRAAARTERPSFTAPVKLQGGCGGEPSIDVDGRGHVYVSSPKGILTGVASCQGAATLARGAATWVSPDGGAHFGPMVSAGTANGGGDTDTIVDRSSGDVYLSDLEAVGSDICVSHDHGASYVAYPGGAEPCSADLPQPPESVTNQTGFDDDREWLSAYGPTATYPHKDVYLSYHDFTLGVPLQWRSQDGGPFELQTAPAMTDPAFASAVLNGTVESKPVIDRHGTIYALVTTEGPAQGPLNHLWLIKSTDHGASWTDRSIFAGSSNATLGLIFNDLAIDGAGNLYALALGNSSGPVPPVHAYLFTSRNAGATWSPPVDLNPHGKALALPALHAGPRAGELAIGWYGSTNTTDPNDLRGLWVYDALESTNALAGRPAFTRMVLGASENAKGFVHQGQICTEGTLCSVGQVIGGGQGNRNLADFTSVTIDQHGCALYTYGDDGAILPDQSNFDFSLVNNDVTRQTAGCFATRPGG